jgi:hypothetical protein
MNKTGDAYRVSQIQEVGFTFCAAVLMADGARTADGDTANAKKILTTSRGEGIDGR